MKLKMFGAVSFCVFASISFLQGADHSNGELFIYKTPASSPVADNSSPIPPILSRQGSQGVLVFDPADVDAYNNEIEKKLFNAFLDAYVQCQYVVPEAFCGRDSLADSSRSHDILRSFNHAWALYKEHLEARCKLGLVSLYQNKVNELRHWLGECLIARK